MIYRLNFISEIERTWLRRFLLLLFFIPLLLINWFIALFCAPVLILFFTARRAYRNTMILIDSFALRWNVKKEKTND